MSAEMGIDTPMERGGETAKSELLGEGSQSHVYDIGNERVSKIPKSLAHAAKAVEQWQKEGPESARSYAIQLEEYRLRANKFVAKTIAAHPETGWFFGNPHFLENGVVEQDKVSPFGRVLEGLSGKPREAMLDELIGAIKNSWRLGCFDVTFNFAANYGVNETGIVILIDFGEMGYDKDLMHQLISERRWEKSYDASQLSIGLRAKYFSKMQQEITHETLETRWRAGLN